MIQRCIVCLGVSLILFGCKNPSDSDTPSPTLVEMVVVDSSIVKEKNYFLNGQLESKLIQDSIIVVSSIKSPGISSFHINGDELGQITAKNHPEAPFIPSSFDLTDYPIIYILDRKRGVIQKFDLENNFYFKSIKLKLPEGKAPKLALSKFKKVGDNFFVELENSFFDAYDPNYYNDLNKMIYSFDSLGNPIDGFLQYPKIIKDYPGSISAQNYLVSSHLNKYFLFSFPHEGLISRISDSFPFEVSEQIMLPKSRYFNYQLVGSERSISSEDMMAGGELDSTPLNHNFIKIIENDEKIYIQTWMIEQNSFSAERQFFTHLIIYDKIQKLWYENIPRLFFELGHLAGVANDTLYFFEGNLRLNDEKYIKRAVLRPIED